MSKAPTTWANDPLARVRESLLARARADAERVRADAAAEADALLEQARQQAEAILAEARERGASEGAEISAAARARARRRARGLVLASQRQAYETLRERSRDAVRALRDDPSYRRLRQRLERIARELAGASAVIVEAPDGGVVAEGSGRRIDCSLGALADRAVDALGAEVEELWAP
jgi:vacuolar-type H+-ATPase subunit E/Vma4